jgi:hypothetical protein
MIEQAGGSAIKTCIVIAGFFLVMVFTAGAAQARIDDETDYDGIISSLAEKYGVEPALVKAVIRTESRFNCQAVSRRGARGLMQLMPPVARSHGVVDPTDPWQNIRAGVRVLRALLDRFDGDMKLALAGYNAGGDSVERHGGVPPYRETRRYVIAVMKFRERYLRQPIGADPEDEEELVRSLKAAWPRRAESIRFGDGLAADGSALRAASHSPEQYLGHEPNHRLDVP